MLFDTLQFWVFFAAVVLLIACAGPSTGRTILVLSSYVFYAFWDIRFLLLLGGSTVANYLFGLWIQGATGRSRRRALIVSVAANLAVLGFFKYFGFLTETLAALTGLDPKGMFLRIVLPVGISFFTFEGIAYAVDVYRGDVPAVRKLWDFALFVSFFPHLIAGPIIRPADFFPQVGKTFALTEIDARWGLREILKGLFKKIALSNLFAPIADAYFNAGTYANTAVPAWAGVLAFSMQIYFDFSGYTDIARGCARLLGYRFPTNFERPYLSMNISEFWRRWHISLSKWLRDYLYISLGGNRKGSGRTYINLMLVMFLGGLWHGASWNFAVWGAYHGALLILLRFWRLALERLGAVAFVDRRVFAPLWVALTFTLVSLGWIPFRAASFATSWATLKEVLSLPDFGFVAVQPAILLVPALTLVFCLLDPGRRVQEWLVERAPLPAFVTAAALGCMALEVFGLVDAQIPFVYFQF